MREGRERSGLKAKLKKHKIVVIRSVTGWSVRSLRHQGGKERAWKVSRCYEGNGWCFELMAVVLQCFFWCLTWLMCLKLAVLVLQWCSQCRSMYACRALFAVLLITLKWFSENLYLKTSTALKHNDKLNHWKCILPQAEPWVMPQSVIIRMVW